jgi:hypothetical protein
MLTKYLLTNHLLRQGTRLRERRTPAKPHSRPANPFRIHGTVEGPFFTDRADELARTLASLREPGAKLLLYGPRRMGKTSLLQVAITRLSREGQPAFLADLSKASTVTDMAFRILDAASRALGPDWKTWWQDLAPRLSAVASWAPDPSTGVFVPRFELSLRRAPVEDQRATLGTVLDAIEASAKARKVTLGVILDEFQEIHRFGGEDAEWHLRGVVQHHRHVSYVFAGSEEHLIHEMIGPSHAFYQLLDPLPIGPIEPEHLARWIDERMRAAGLRGERVGEWIVAAAGPRTRDILRVARKCFDLARPSGTVTAAEAYRAYLEVVDDDGDLLQADWSSLTAHQQNLLRALAAGVEKLTGEGARGQFTLPSSSAVTQALATFVEQGELARSERPPGYAFDSPFKRAWVIRNALPDIGLEMDPVPRPATLPPSTGAHPSGAAARRTKRG